MTQRIEIQGLQIDSALHRFIEQNALPDTGLDAGAFWSGFSQLVHDLAPKNRALLAERDRLQTELDQWHAAHPGPIKDMPAYREFLTSIGYLKAVPDDFRISTANTDSELTQQAGPQLVVPVMNGRYALNAANARWGSLYDALYGTDAISDENGAERGHGSS
jgi:malate synthase